MAKLLLQAYPIGPEMVKRFSFTQGGWPSDFYWTIGDIVSVIATKAHELAMLAAGKQNCATAYLLAVLEKMALLASKQWHTAPRTRGG